MFQKYALLIMNFPCQVEKYDVRVSNMIRWVWLPYISWDRRWSCCSVWQADKWSCYRKFECYCHLVY